MTKSQIVSEVYATPQWWLGWLLSGVVMTLAGGVAGLVVGGW